MSDATTLRTIRTKGFEAALLGSISSNASYLMYLHILGPRDAVEAIWAKLSSSDMRGAGFLSTITIKTPDSEGGVALAKGTRYLSQKTLLPKSGYTDCVMLHPSCTPSEIGMNKSQYLIVPSVLKGVPAPFYERLNGSLPIAMDETWADWLWTDGLKNDVITPLHSEGDMQGYALSCSNYAVTRWLSLIERHLTGGN